ncbi:MAG: hypothetical protein HFJ45_04685 [Clostridia bacterium]|nr:hypothetical protein [Clostridia bacterium]
MNSKIQELKEKLMNNQMTVLDLSNDEVKILKKEFKNDLDINYKNLEKINKKIREIKVKIDNWA